MSPSIIIRFDSLQLHRKWIRFFQLRWSRWFLELWSLLSSSKVTSLREDPKSNPSPKRSLNPITKKNLLSLLNPSPKNLTPNITHTLTAIRYCILFSSLLVTFFHSNYLFYLFKKNHWPIILTVKCNRRIKTSDIIRWMLILLKVMVIPSPAFVSPLMESVWRQVKY